LKIKKLIIAVFISLIIGLLAGIGLMPSVPVWKILLLLIIPFAVFFILKKLGDHSYKKIPSEKLPPKLDQFEILNHLLKNIEDGNWGEKNQEFIILKKTHPSLANQLLKIQHLYQSNKQFTQNTAHELQTPLAIIKGHAELLLQAPSLDEKEAKAIGAILQNINRLSRINTTLILLSKIEHGRFADEQLVCLNEIVEATLDHFSDAIDLQKIKIEKLYAADFTVNMSTTLAEILMANLLQNAIRHNLSEGYIKIEINKKELKISNPGKPLATAPENLFTRFYRESKKEESLGLGLSIVKMIAEQSRLEVGYAFGDGVHTVSIKSKD
jgi:signal transduction histidine kinase